MSIRSLLLFLLLSLSAGLVSATKTIHVFVALADNKHQGIVPVPAKLGNGQDPGRNLYWGALYGVKTHFSRSEDWVLIRSIKDPCDKILERCLFKHRTRDVVLVADAYDGRSIQMAIADFLQAAGGLQGEYIDLDGKAAGIYGHADLVAYTGHNGLMEFDPPQLDPQRGRDAIVLACASQPYFEPLLQSMASRPVLLTTNLMAPEAYTLEAAIEAWLEDEPATVVRERAASAYHRYQQCGMKGARSLFFADD